LLFCFNLGCQRVSHLGTNRVITGESKTKHTRKDFADVKIQVFEKNYRNKSYEILIDCYSLIYCDFWCPVPIESTLFQLKQTSLVRGVWVRFANGAHLLKFLYLPEQAKQKFGAIKKSTIENLYWRWKSSTKKYQSKTKRNKLMNILRAHQRDLNFYYTNLF